MIKDEIAHTQHKLSKLKKDYKNLVSRIKETFYKKEEYFVEDSPRKPEDESSKMQAALCLVEQKCPRIKYDLDIRKAREWVKGGDYITFDYWVINQDRFKIGGITPATIIINKKNIKSLEDICRELWVIEVSNSKTIIGFKEWVEVNSVDRILELMMENLNQYENERVYLVTDKNLYLKDIVIIFPSQPKNKLIF